MFNKAEHIKKQQPAVKKFIGWLESSKKITFTPTDGEFENVILKSKDKEIKISHHSFYRFSGIAVLYAKTGENSFQITEITDDIFFDTFMKPIVEALFKTK